MVATLPRAALFVVLFVSLAMAEGKCQVSNIAPERIITRKGMAVVREKPFFSNDLVKCISFVRIEDRTAADNPAHGYLVFLTGAGEVKLPPQAVEELFFRDDLHFQEIMKPSTDLDRLAELQESLGRASRLNESVRSALASSLERVTDAVKRLRNDEWWEFPTGWISREGRNRRTAQAQRGAIDASFGAVRGDLSSARDINGITKALDAIGELENLPATSSEVANYRHALAAKLRSEAEMRRSELEEAYVGSVHAKLKDAIENARSLEDLMATAVTIEELANAVITSSAALSAKEKRLTELSDLRRNKERMVRLAAVIFDDLDAWKQAIDESRALGAAAELETTLQHSEDLHKEALEIHRQLDGALSKFLAFSARLPAKAILSGEELPPPPSDGDAVLQNFDKFVRASGESSPISVGELDQAARRLKRNLTLYRQLVSLSPRAKRKDLWRVRDSLQEVLSNMTAVQTAINDEEEKYLRLIDAGRRYEASRNFAPAAGAYQSAHDIAPSADLAERIETLKAQDLGL